MYLDVYTITIPANNILIARKPVFGARDMIMLKPANSATETI